MFPLVLCCVGLQLSSVGPGIRNGFASQQSSPIRMTSVSEPLCQDEAGIRLDAEMAFKLLDLDGDREISRDELGSYLTRYRYTESAITKIFTALDLDGNGVLTTTELQDGLVDYCKCEQCEAKFYDETLAEADAIFDQIDDNGDGEVSGAELRQHLASIGYAEPAVDAIFQSLDSDDDGVISQEELRVGFLSYAAVRQAIVAVVTTLVKKRAW